MSDSLEKQLRDAFKLVDEQRTVVDVSALQERGVAARTVRADRRPALGASEPWPDFEPDAGDSRPGIWDVLTRPRVFTALMAVVAVPLAVALVLILSSTDTGAPERAERPTDVVASRPGGEQLAPAARVPTSLSWIRVPHDEAVFGGPGDQDMLAVVAGGPGLVAVGVDGHLGVPSPADVRLADAAAWASVDGVSWTRARVYDDESVVGAESLQVMADVTVGGPGLVAVGHDRARQGFLMVAAVWTSVDGLSWTRVPHDEAGFGSGERFQTMREVVAGGPGLVAVGTAGGAAAVWTSVDGLIWSRVPHDEALFGGPGFTSIRSVAVGGPGLVAVGQSGGGTNLESWKGRGSAVVWTSTDGLSWSRVPHDEAVFGGPGDQWMLDVTPVGSGLAAVGLEGGPELPDNGHGEVVWTSTDGLAWSRVPQSELAVDGEGNRWIGRLRDEPGLVIVDGHLWTSADGASWSGNSGVEGAASTILAGPGLVAVGSVGESTEGRGPTDEDAAVWTATLEN